MRRHIVLVLMTLFIFINLTGAYYGQGVQTTFGTNEYSKIRSLTNKSNVSISDVCESDKRCLWKCCPLGQHLHHQRSKECIPTNLEVDVSNITLYDINLYSTNKSLESVFQLVPEIMSNELFKNYSGDYSYFKQYLAEDGKLYIELPNLFDRWLIINTDHFCVDAVDISNESIPIILAEIPTVQLTETVVSETYALAVTIGFLFLTILPYVIFSKLRDQNGIILIIFIMFFIIPMATKLYTIFYEPLVKLDGRIIAFCYYFTLMSSFCWTNVMFCRFQQFLRIQTKDVIKSKKCVWGNYFIYTLGLPLNITIFLGIIEISDLSHMPWFVQPQISKMNNIVFQTKESLYYLYIPLAVLLLYNWMICLKYVFKIYQESRITIKPAENYKRNRKSPLNRPTLYVVLLILLTILCIMRVLEIIYPESVLFKNMSVIYTMCIGPAMFITFVMNKNVLTKQSSTKTKSDYPSPQWIWFKNGEDSIIFD